MDRINDGPAPTGTMPLHLQPARFPRFLNLCASKRPHRLHWQAIFRVAHQKSAKEQPRRRRRSWDAVSEIRCRQSPSFRLGLALPLHPFGCGPPGANLSLCFRCRPVSPIRRLCSLPELLHVIFGLSAHPCRPHGRFPSGLNAGNGGTESALAAHHICCPERWAAMTHSQAWSWRFFGPRWSVGNRLIAVLQRLLDPKTRSPAEAEEG